MSDHGKRNNSDKNNKYLENIAVGAQYSVPFVCILIIHKNIDQIA